MELVDKTVKNVSSSTILRKSFEFVAVFVIIYFAAKLGQYFFFELKTSPAILWPPTGIAVAIIWLRGYRYAIPIFFGLFVSSLTGPVGYLFPAVITTPTGQVLGHIAAVYLLKRFNFSGSLSNTRSVLTLLGSIMLACMVAPTITTAISAMTGNLTAAAYYSWSRSWGGYVFSSLLLVPLVIAWMTPQIRALRRSNLELILAAAFLLLSVYFLFWTRIAASYSFIFFGMFFISHFWMGYRFSERIVALSMFATAVLAFCGLFLSPAPERALNTQLFNTELFFLLIFPIFYVFSALVKERARTIEELKEVMAKITNESNIKNEFIAVLAHELRNPLAPIKTTLELLALQNVDADTKKLITNAHREVHAMRRLLDDLLDITRVTQGKFQLQIERSNLCSMITQSIEATKDLYTNRRHTLVVDPPCDPTIWLDVDPVRFEQVIVNILNNAAKYTNPGGRVEIGHSVKGNTVEIRIRDNGLGVEKEHFKDIFEPFWQKNTESRGRSGIGIGLSLTKRIAEMHNGTIEVESPGPGKGSTFIVRMPVATSKEETRSPLPVKAPKRTGTFKILVADDNEAAADSLSKLLSLKGYETKTAYSGEGVLEVTKWFQPDIILLDIGLPEMTGYEVAEKLRATGFTGTLIAVSGYGQEEDKQQALRAGFNHHFTKPVSIVRFEEYFAELDNS